jgi:hypothetical protein
MGYLQLAVARKRGVFLICVVTAQRTRRVANYPLRKHGGDQGFADTAFALEHKMDGVMDSQAESCSRKKRQRLILLLPARTSGINRS